MNIIARTFRQLAAAYIAAVWLAGGLKPVHADEPIELKSLIGQSVNILLADGTGFRGVDVVQVVPGTKKGTMRALIYRPDKKSKPLTLLAPQIAEIELRGEPLDLELDAKSKTVAPSAEKREARLAALNKLREKLEAGQKLGWQAVSAEEFAKYTEEEKAFAKETVEKTVGVKLECIETERWLVYTDLSPGEMTKYIKVLDDSYTVTARLLGLADDARLFRSKLPVCFFSTLERMKKLEQDVYKNNDAKDYDTWIHWYKDGRVVLNARQTQDTRQVAGDLGYQMTQGMLYRFGSMTRLPTWIEIGLGSLVSIRTTPGGSYYADGQQSGMAAFKTKKEFFKDFFATTEALDDEGYGVATALLDKLDKQDVSRLRQLIVALKAGLTMDEAIQLAYRCDLTKFVKSCAIELGVPDAKLAQ